MHWNALKNMDNINKYRFLLYNYKIVLRLYKDNLIIYSKN